VTDNLTSWDIKKTHMNCIRMGIINCNSTKWRKRHIPLCFESHLSYKKLWHQRSTWRLCKSDHIILFVREVWTVKWLKYRTSFSALRRRRPPGFYLLSHGCKVHKLILRRWWRHPIVVIIFVWLSLSLYTIFTAHGIYKRELPELWSCSTPLQTVHLR